MSQTSTVTLAPREKSSIPLTATPSTSTSTDYEKEFATAAVTLRSLYSRAARAFLQRDITLTFTLITSAFPLIPSPPSLDDPLSNWRRKWDILRITLEITVYATPPADSETLPPYLRSNSMLSPQSLLAALYTRSLVLFTPVLPESDVQGNPSVTHIPTQVLITLVLASMKLGVPEVGRSIIEDWLAKRTVHQDPASEDGEMYDKVIELYCLHILPRLEEWEYATEFLQDEGQLEPVRRHRLMYSLENLHAETNAIRQRRRMSSSTPSLSPTSLAFSRPVSPAGSSTSSTSEETATPRTPRFDAADPKGMRKSVSMSMTSISLPTSVSNSTNTSRTATPMPGPVTAKPKYKQKQRFSVTQAPVLEPPTLASSVGTPSTLAILKSTLSSLVKFSFTSRINLATVLIVAFALISFIRFRRSRKPQITNGGSSNASMARLKNLSLKVRSKPDGMEEVGLLGVSTKSAVEEVRKNLATSGGVSANLSTGLLRSVWNEAVRAVGDTVRMGGRGLV